MKRILLIPWLLVMLTGSLCHAQNKDCDFVKMKMSDGSVSEMIKTTGALGNLLIGKYEGKVTLFYSTKGFFAQNPKNAAVLRIDSVKFVFTDNSIIGVRLYSGIGTLANVNNEIQPHISNAQFSVALIAGSEIDNKLKTKKVKAFTVVAQKEAQYGDVFNEKQQDKLLQAFTCIGN